MFLKGFRGSVLCFQQEPSASLLVKTPLKAGHQCFSAAIFLCSLNKAFKLQLIDVRPDSEAVSSFVYPQLVQECLDLFRDGCLLLGLATKLHIYQPSSATFFCPPVTA